MLRKACNDRDFLDRSIDLLSRLINLLGLVIINTMIEAIFGNKTAAQVMLYLFHYGEAYANGLARDMKITLSQVQKQLDKFEAAGILVSKKMGTVRIYSFNPKLGVTKKIKELIQVFYDSIPLEQREEMFHERRRPRRKGKPVIKKIKNEN